MKKIIFMITFIIIVFTFDINQTIACPEGEGWGEAQCIANIPKNTGGFCQVTVHYCIKLIWSNDHWILDIWIGTLEFNPPGCIYDITMNTSFWYSINESIWNDLKQNHINAFLPCSSSTYTITRFTMDHCRKLVNNLQLQIISLVPCSSNFLCQKTYKVCIISYDPPIFSQELIDTQVGQSDCGPWNTNLDPNTYPPDVAWETPCMTPNYCY